MNYTQLQAELRSIAKRIEELEFSVEQMKPKTEEEKKNEYTSIQDLAGKYPLPGRGLEETNENTRSMYLKLLSVVASLDEDFYKGKLLYITRIAAGISGREYSAEKIVKMAKQFEKGDLSHIKTDLESVKNWFLVDMLSVTYLYGEPTEKVNDFVAGMATIIGYSADDFEVLTSICKCILTENFDYLNVTADRVIDYKWCGMFADVIPAKWFAEHRCFCGRYCTNNGCVSFENLLRIAESEAEATKVCEVKERCKAGTIVKKGALLVKYIEKPNIIFPYNSGIIRTWEDERVRVIKSPRDGIVYFIEDEIKNTKTDAIEKYVEVYVVSCFDEYGIFCRWYKTVTKAWNGKGQGGRIGNIWN